MENEIRWEGPEFHFHEKGEGWGRGAIAIGGIVMLIAIFQKNFLFAIFIAIATFLVLTWGNRRPRTVGFILSDHGLKVGEKKFYAHENLSGFAMVPSRDHSSYTDIVIREKGSLGGWTKFMIENDLAEQARELLNSSLPELEYEESLAEHIARILRF